MATTDERVFTERDRIAVCLISMIVEILLYPLLIRLSSIINVRTITVGGCGVRYDEVSLRIFHLPNLNIFLTQGPSTEVAYNISRE